jgi:hypothetical protein
VDGGGVADGELVVPGGEAAVVFEVVEAALDGVPVLVGLGVEGRWPSAVGAAAGAVGGLVGGDRDGRSDVVPGEPGPVRAGGVGLVGQDPLGPPPGLPAVGSGDADAVEHADHLG